MLTIQIVNFFMAANIHIKSVRSAAGQKNLPLFLTYLTPMLAEMIYRSNNKTKFLKKRGREGRNIVRIK